MDVITVLQKPCINKILTTKKQKEIILEKNFEMRWNHITAFNKEKKKEKEELSILKKKKLNRQ